MVRKFWLVSLVSLGFACMLALSQAGTALAEDGSGCCSEGGEVYFVEEWGFPPPGSSEIYKFCAVDQYGGQWHLTASNGGITGYRDKISDCVWNVSGAYHGKIFHMDLVLTAGGNSCCTSGYTDGVVDVKTRTDKGDTYWTGNCHSGPWPYYWTQCP